MKTSVIGFPRVGKLRELKFATEKYFKGEEDLAELESTAKGIRKEQWLLQKNSGLDYISSNDFSFYDQMLDTTVMLGAVPKRYIDLNLDSLNTYFAMARGYQGEKGDVKAFAMKKWFNTNYHYMVPELYPDTKFSINASKLINEYEEALELGVTTKPVIIGPFTYLSLAACYNGARREDFIFDLTGAYISLFEQLSAKNIKFVQIDEPFLVTDLSSSDIEIFRNIYGRLLSHKNGTKVLLQTYFGDIRDCYNEVMNLGFDAVGLDFLEGKKTLELIEEYGFPSEKTLFAGVVNGKNIWKCNYEKVLGLLGRLNENVADIVINTSCSLLHVPYTLENETKLSAEIEEYFSFAYEKLGELKELGELSENTDYASTDAFLSNQKVFVKTRVHEKKDIIEQVDKLQEEDFVRLPARSERESIQKKALNLPLFPTTTIGSFPQTIEVKKNRSRYRKGEIDKKEYDRNVEGFIEKCIRLQEKLGLDVLVHGEFERNDMVEFFGENLDGYVFTEKAWVQSYGTRCVKPPIIFGDIKRSKPITVDYSVYAQSLTDKPVKGMLTGPVTILNWSFPREDVSLKEMAYQIGLAIRQEVLDLEKAGIKIIQIDEAALKEKLPIRKADWHSEYLDWAIRAFRLCHSGVKAETQIHTHMCYSEFDAIVRDIDNMDADVITFEASRSKLTILNALKECNFETEVGPGVYDIHSPRVPSVEEIETAIAKMLEKVDRNKLWINPDCGLKTRGETETVASLTNLVAAERNARNS